MPPRPRVSVYLGVSLDGCIARPDGRLDWLDAFNDPAVGDSGYAAFSGSADTLILGRATFDTELGAGRRLFDDTVPTTALRLVDSRAFPNGVVQLRHELRR